MLSYPVQKYFNSSLEGVLFRDQCVSLKRETLSSYSIAESSPDTASRGRGLDAFQNKIFGAVLDISFGRS